MTDEELRKAEAEYLANNKRTGLYVIAFGIAMIAGFLFLSTENVPLLRQGKMLILLAIGVVAVIAGTIRWLNPLAFRDWL